MQSAAQGLQVFILIYLESDCRMIVYVIYCVLFLHYYDILIKLIIMHQLFS